MGRKELFFEGRCKVCKSPNRSVYEEMRMKKPPATLHELERESKILKDPYDPSYGSFQRHFAKHFIPYVKEKMKREKFTDTLVKEKMKQSVHIIDEMMQNLQICRRIVTNLTDLIADNLEDLIRGGETSILNTLKGLLAETRLTIESTQKLRNSLMVEPQESTEQSIGEILDILQESLTEKDLVNIAAKMRERLS